MEGQYQTGKYNYKRSKALQTGEFPPKWKLLLIVTHTFHLSYLSVFERVIVNLSVFSLAVKSFKVQQYLMYWIETVFFCCQILTRKGSVINENLSCMCHIMD